MQNTEKWVAFDPNENISLCPILFLYPSSYESSRYTNFSHFHIQESSIIVHEFKLNKMDPDNSGKTQSII